MHSATGKNALKWIWFYIYCSGEAKLQGDNFGRVISTKSSNILSCLKSPSNVLSFCEHASIPEKLWLESLARWWLDIFGKRTILAKERISSRPIHSKIADLFSSDWMNARICYIYLYISEPPNLRSAAYLSLSLSFSEQSFARIAKFCNFWKVRSAAYLSLSLCVKWKYSMSLSHC